MVALFHFSYENEFAKNLILSNFIVRQGDLFVDFFFVLSGFVITLNYHDKLLNKSAFIKYITKRFFRLYPLLLYTSLLFFLFLLLANTFFSGFINNKYHLSNLTLQLLDTLLFLNSTVLITKTPGMNFPSWSISAEMISYITFGIVMLCFKKASLYINSFILVFSLIFLISVGNHYTQTSEWGFIRGLICFFMGYYTFILFKNYKNYTINNAWEYIIVITLISILYIRYNYITNIQIFSIVFIPALFSISIFIFSLSNGYLVKIMSGKIFQFLGKISYSIYLNHALLSILITKCSLNLLKVPINGLNTTLIIGLYFATLIIYSHFTYKYIEVKGRKILHKTYSFIIEK